MLVEVSVRSEVVGSVDVERSAAEAVWLDDAAVAEDRAARLLVDAANAALASINPGQTTHQLVLVGGEE